MNAPAYYLPAIPNSAHQSKFCTSHENQDVLRVESGYFRSSEEARRGVSVALLSFLFNWPSTGGGIIHTVELAQFLERAGYDVRLFHAQYRPWNLGGVENCPFPAEALVFESNEWNLVTIQSRFREAVDAFAPDYVLITDSWNIKPYLAQAVCDYRYILRLQAMECLCPLNNLRLLVDRDGVMQCSKNQLADPDECVGCLNQRGQFSGQLHQLERTLCEVGTPAYRDLLYRSFREAEAVLTLNRFTADLIAPFARNVRVVTWGMNPDRFPKPENETNGAPKEKTVLLFAGLVPEFIKGFEILREACRQLWQKRQDFELRVTGDLSPDNEPFLRGVGWLTQAELPRLYREAEVLVVPSIAQEGLSRTAVEAMASARPVVGSRIGGLVELIEEGVTGLLANPGDPRDLANRISELLDNPELRREMGRRARERFERDFSWPTVIARDYGPLFSPKGNGKRRPAHSNQQLPPQRRLEIGPGDQVLAGFETVDVTGQPNYRARWGTDRLSDLTGPSIFDEVYASHVLEHILWNRTHSALRDVYEILKPGGVFEVWVPDFEYIIGCYQRRICGDSWRRDNPQADPMLWVNGRIFTYGPDENNLHHACFDYEHLSNCLSRTGFVEIERLPKRTRGVSHGPIDLGVRCVRPQVDREGDSP